MLLGRVKLVFLGKQQWRCIFQQRIFIDMEDQQVISVWARTDVGTNEQTTGFQNLVRTEASIWEFVDTFICFRIDQRLVCSAFSTWQQRETIQLL